MIAWSGISESVNSSLLIPSLQPQRPVNPLVSISAVESAIIDSIFEDKDNQGNDETSPLPQEADKVGSVLRSISNTLDPTVRPISYTKSDAQCFSDLV